MLLDITPHLKKEIKGIIQVGAHTGGEYNFLKNISKNILMFEPQNKIFKILKENVGSDSGVIIENYAVGSVSGKMNMYIEKNNLGMSSSLLRPHLHALQYPTIEFNETEQVEVITLNEYFKNKFFNYNLMVLDVQGYELEVLKGCSEHLNNVDYILCEVNQAELYKNCAMVGEIDEYLSKFNLKRYETYWAGHTWGDALYVKE